MAFWLNKTTVFIYSFIILFFFSLQHYPSQKEKQQISDEQTKPDNRLSPLRSLVLWRTQIHCETIIIIYFRINLVLLGNVVAVKN